MTYGPEFSYGSGRYPGASGKGDASAALRLSTEFMSVPLFKVRPALGRPGLGLGGWV